MQRYFGNIQDGFAYLSEDDQFHVVKVMRGKVNDQIEVVSDEKLFLCDIISLKPLKIRVGKEISTNVELLFGVHHLLGPSYLPSFIGK